MVNPVYAHEFRKADVLDIFVEMALLAGAKCLWAAACAAITLVSSTELINLHTYVDIIVPCALPSMHSIGLC